MFESLTRRVLEPPAFGLDISDLTVKFCRLDRRRRSLGIAYFGELAIPEGVVVGGEIRNVQGLVRVLREGLKSSGGERVLERYCVVSLPEEKSFVGMIQLPAMSPADVSRAIRWEVEGVIPMPLEEIYYDYEALPSQPVTPAHRDVVIMAFLRSIVLSYEESLRQAGFCPLVLELESQAISRALATEAIARESYIVVDIGATRTSFIILAQGAVIFTKSVATGGSHFEAAIATGLGVSLEEARKIKIDVGLNKNYRDGSVFTLLQPLVDSFRQELLEQIRFYREHPRAKHAELGEIAGVLLCGGDANLIGLEKYLAVGIKKPVKLGDPFATLDLPPASVPPISRSHAQKYTTAIGLALRAAGL